MKLTSKILAFAAVATALVSAASAASETYKIDPVHSSVCFKIRHIVGKVPGAFTKFSGTVTIDRDNMENNACEATIEVGSLCTFNDYRDADLKKPAYFDAEKFATITFKSKKIAPAGEGELKITGDLTIHGVTKEVVLNAEGPTAEGKDPFGNIRIGASGSTKIKRSDFGLTYNAALETGGILIGDDLKIELEISAIRAVAAAA